MTVKTPLYVLLANVPNPKYRDINSLDCFIRVLCSLIRQKFKQRVVFADF